MAFNNGYPATYQPMTYSHQNYTMNNQNVPTNSIVWVQGEAGAKAYPVIAGGSAILMDSEKNCFYIKSTDHSGMPMPLRIFNYTEITQNNTNNNTIQNNIDTSNFVTQEQFNKLQNELDRLTDQLSTKSVTKGKSDK